MKREFRDCMYYHFLNIQTASVSILVEFQLWYGKESPKLKI